MDNMAPHRACYGDQYRGLPAEIRLKIWEYMIPPVTTVLGLDYLRTERREYLPIEKLPKAFKVLKQRLGMRIRAITEFKMRHIDLSNSLNLQILQLNQAVREEAQPLFAQRRVTYDLTELDDEHVGIFLQSILEIPHGLHMMDGIRLARHYSDDELEFPDDPLSPRPCNVPIPAWSNASKAFVNKLTIVFDTSRWRKDAQEADFLESETGQELGLLMRRVSDDPGSKYERLCAVARVMWSPGVAKQYTRLLVTGVVKQLVLEFKGCERIQRVIAERLVHCTIWNRLQHDLNSQVRAEVETVGDKYDVCVVATGSIEGISAQELPVHAA